MGSELSAASGRGSEVSEWPRSKFPASAVRQRRNFGHRNRIIGPYEMVCRGGRLCPPGMAHNIFVGQGPCALPGVRYKAGRRGEGTPPYGGTRSTAKRGVEDAAPYGWGTRATVRIAPTNGLQRVNEHKKADLGGGRRMGWNEWVKFPAHICP